jgi:hypothetical protein
MVGVASGSLAPCFAAPEWGGRFRNWSVMRQRVSLSNQALNVPLL